MGTKLYVGNLAWSLSEADLAEAFSEVGSVVSAQIPLNDRGQSRGFGFVEMSTEEEAAAAIEKFNGVEMGGRPVRVNEAGQGGERSEGGRASGEVNNKKLFVGNLPWSLGEAELTEMFSEAGSVVSTRLPLNERGQSRGIAFVEMESDEAAQKAIEIFHGKEVEGRAMTVNVARPQSARPPRRDYAPRDNWQDNSNWNAGY